MAAMTRAVVLDLDGTLTDTETLWDGIRRGLAADAGLPWPDDASTRMMGMSTQQWSAYLVEDVGLPGSPPEVAARTIGAMRQHYRDGVDLLPGAPDVVRRLGAVWPLGVASSSPRVLIDAALEAMDVADLVAASVSTEETGHGKPAPDVYLEVCRRLGVAPQDAVAIEDSPAGIRSAQAAGMRLIVVPPRFHPPTPDVLALADVVVATLDEITVELVEDLLGGR